MKMIPLWIALYLLLAGSSIMKELTEEEASYREIRDQDGKTAYTIDCSGARSHWGHCYEKAGNLCDTRGYTMLSKHAEDSGYHYFSNRRREAYKRTETHSYNSVISRTLIIRCKPYASEESK